MSQCLIIIVILLLLICAAAMTLWLDARQKRIDRQLAIALPTSHSASLPSIRRLQAESGWSFLHRLANYNAEIAYDWHPAYV
ncbi:MAG: pilus assembly protein TadB, partial [Pseudolabrys sp.]